jgi:hypothetical protein
MACLRYLSLCPCPRCLLLKSRIPMIGSKTDTKQRICLARVDSENRRKTIELARKFMFEAGANITSSKIDNLLQPTSLVPTRVCFYIPFHLMRLILTCRTLSRSAYLLTVLISMKCSFQIYSMNSSWAFGKPSSHTFFASCMHLARTRSRP